MKTSAILRAIGCTIFAGPGLLSAQPELNEPFASGPLDNPPESTLRSWGLDTLTAPVSLDTGAKEAPATAMVNWNQRPMKNLRLERDVQQTAFAALFTSMWIDPIQNGQAESVFDRMAQAYRRVIERRVHESRTAGPAGAGGLNATAAPDRERLEGRPGGISDFGGFSNSAGAGTGGGHGGPSDTRDRGTVELLEKDTGRHRGGGEIEGVGVIGGGK
jgi:hypothetical protein